MQKIVCELVWNFSLLHLPTELQDSLPTVSGVSQDDFNSSHPFSIMIVSVASFSDRIDSVDVHLMTSVDRTESIGATKFTDRERTTALTIFHLPGN